MEEEEEEVDEITGGVWRRKEAVLNLSHRRIKVLPAKVANFTFVKTLLLNDNDILMPPEEISHLSQLECLCLEHNQLTLIPSGIASLSPTLSFLNLSHNPLTYLSPAISQLYNLRSLWLAHTQLISFPDQICSLHKLTHLSLEGNHILSFSNPSPFAKLKELKWVSFAKNKLNSVGEVFSSLPLLHTIYLQQNCLTEVPNVSLCPSLANLDLSANDVSSLPQDMSHFKTMLKLDLRGNPITLKDESSHHHENVDIIL